ncbi:class I SAM-dependent methyltransferase [Biformimicrobium ophioploci]|uniref:Methyltransferase type 11 domain-containing protein n=1 Tax=Biformimicrobium ophioploci TaxID=3036711 RepID=A0ABQ6LYV7_9GAMM|nr:class I SAM-dependent methyltransferase [Microbulbifer sp. NKW57]GMG87272.1 hypothetical protein MNKW57_15930 [Microbulbifer sp. NKW57]
MSHEHWSKFWEQGYITTFGSSLKNNYSGSLKSFWQEQFSLLADGSRILDVATGNGAIAVLAADYSLELRKGFSVYGADASTISAGVTESNSPARSAVQFLSETPCEELPFEDDYFALVTSQYGVEYSNLERSAKEIYRILKPGGSFQAVIHHADSNLLKSSRSELEIYRYVLDTAQVYPVLKKYIEHYQGKADQLRQVGAQLNHGINSLRQQFGTMPLAREVQADISALARKIKTGDSKTLFIEIDSRAAELVAARSRLQDMVAAAVSDPAQFEGIFRAAGFEGVTMSELNNEQGLIGWLLGAKVPSKRDDQ